MGDKNIFRKIITKEEISIKGEFSASISVVFVMLKMDPSLITKNHR